jgi:hypothetical protein
MRLPTAPPARRAHRLALLLLAGLLVGAGTPPPPRRPAADTPRTAITWHWSAPALGFVPADSRSERRQQPGTSCQYDPGGLTLPLTLQVALSLPDGAHVTFLELGGRDADAGADMELTFVEAEATGAVRFSAPVRSSGAPGASTWGVPLDRVIDNFQYTYALVWQADGAGPGLQLCGAFVDYDIPSRSVLLPWQSYHRPP